MSRLLGILGAGTKEEVASPPAARARAPPPEPETIAGVLDTYRVPSGGKPDSSAEVFVTDEDGAGRYIVRLPELEEAEAEALSLLTKNLLDSIPVEVTGRPEKVISDHVRAISEEAGIGEVVKASEEKLMFFLLRDFLGFWEIDTLMGDDKIEEVSLTRFDKPARILHRDFTEYSFMESNVVYPSEERLQSFIRRLAQFGGTTVSLAQPSLEVTLHGPSDRRVTATLGDEISRPGSTYSIRKQKERPLTLAQLASPEHPKWRPPEAALPGENPPYEETSSHKTLSALMAAYFWLLLERTTNVLIAGDTNSGKTTLMNSILALANPKAKIATAEDVLEINLPDHLHWQRMKTRSHRALSPSAQRYEYGLPELLKLALRFSPTILSLGEMRGEESETLAAAITLGFSTMTTIHAENAERCVQRLTTPPMRFAEGHVRDITAIATTRKIVLSDGRVARRVVSVDEIKPVGADAHEIVNVFAYDPRTDSFGPTTPAEVVDRSFRLGEIAQSFGWTPAKVQDSLTARAAHLAKASEGDSSPESISAMVRDFARRELQAMAVGP